MVHGFPWSMVHGPWLMVHDSWFTDASDVVLLSEPFFKLLVVILVRCSLCSRALHAPFALYPVEPRRRRRSSRDTTSSLSPQQSLHPSPRTTRMRTLLYPALLLALTQSWALAGPGGWSSMTPCPGAKQDSLPIRGGQASFTFYINSSYDPAKIRRMVFQTHGKGRDVWNYELHTFNALQQAISQSFPKKAEEVLVVAPEFYNQ